MALKIGRGLFRVWLICSIPFSLVVFGLDVPKIIKEFHISAILDSAPRSGKYIVVACDEARGTEERDYVHDADIDRCWYEIKSFRRLYPESSNFPDRQLIANSFLKARAAAGWPHPWQSLGLGLAIALLPPIILLAASKAIFGAIKGFEGTV